MVPDCPRPFRLADFLLPLFAFAVMIAALVGGCKAMQPRSVPERPQAFIQALTNTAPCYSGYCNTNCPYRNNVNYIGCAPWGTGPFCPSGDGVCRGIVLDKLIEALHKGTLKAVPNSNGTFTLIPAKG